LIAQANVVVCAVPDDAASDPLEAVAVQCGVQTFRGSEEDVLSRYLEAARAVPADVVVRVTADCPLIDPDICQSVVSLCEREKADYASNNLARSFPHGLDCEVFTLAALEMASSNSLEIEDREHVTPWLRRAGDLKKANLWSGNPALANHRWTLDYHEDLAFLRALFELIPVNDDTRMSDVLAFLDRHPEIAEINSQRRAFVSR
jgi:spore coat polysaccharide biosynthesis protein SpsF (cytidylyltransferase family)